MAKQDFLKTKPGFVLSGLAALVAAYILGSRAIDTGSWWQYSGTVLLFAFAVNRVAKAIRKK